MSTAIDQLRTVLALLDSAGEPTQTLAKSLRAIVVDLEETSMNECKQLSSLVELPNYFVR
jgi:hypothetical protein